MSLEAKLAAIRTGAATRISADRRAIMQRATDDLRRSGILDRVAKVGTRIPGFRLANHDGTTIDSATLLARGPLVLSFFRGSW